MHGSAALGLTVRLSASHHSGGIYAIDNEGLGGRRITSLGTNTVDPHILLCNERGTYLHMQEIISNPAIPDPQTCFRRDRARGAATR